MVATFELVFESDPQQVADTLRELAAAASDWRPVWRTVLPFLALDLEQAITSEGGSIGEGWERLAPNTIERRRRKGQGYAMLHATGKLLASMKGDRAKRKLTKSALVVGPPSSLAKYAAAQNFGVKSKNIVARRFIKWRTQAENHVISAAQAHIESLVAHFEPRLVGVVGGR